MKTSKSSSHFWYVWLVFKIGFFVYLFIKVYRGTDLRAHPIALLPVILLCLGTVSYILSGLTWRRAGAVPCLRRWAVAFIALSLVTTAGIVLTI